MKNKKVTQIVYTIGRELVDQRTIQMILTIKVYTLSCQTMSKFDTHHILDHIQPWMGAYLWPEAHISNLVVGSFRRFTH